MKWKLVNKKYVGRPGLIFVYLVHEVSGVLSNETALWKFCNELKEKLSDNNWSECIFRYNNKEYSFNYTEEQLSNLDNIWIDMSYDRISETICCDIVTPIIENRTKKVCFEKWSDTCGNIYGNIIKEISSINKEPHVLRTFANDLYVQLEINNLKSFYITANSGNIKISAIPEDIDDPLYDKENHYYHFYIDSNKSANFLEVEKTDSLKTN